MDIFLLFGEVEGIYTTGICIKGYIYMQHVWLIDEKNCWFNIVFLKLFSVRKTTINTINFNLEFFNEHD